ncbi:MAG: hypothetical protein Q9222_001955 [Ikaeria aurantiellina]
MAYTRTCERTSTEDPRSRQGPSREWVLTASLEELLEECRAERAEAIQALTEQQKHFCPPTREVSPPRRARLPPPEPSSLDGDCNFDLQSRFPGIPADHFHTMHDDLAQDFMIATYVSQVAEPGNFDPSSPAQVSTQVKDSTAATLPVMPPVTPLHAASGIHAGTVLRLDHEQSPARAASKSHSRPLSPSHQDFSHQDIRIAQSTPSSNTEDGDQTTSVATSRFSGAAGRECHRRESPSEEAELLS